MATEAARPPSTGILPGVPPGVSDGMPDGFAARGVPPAPIAPAAAPGPGCAAAPPLSAEQERAWYAYRRMQARLASQLNRRLIAETGLSEADFEILAALRSACEQRSRALALRCAVDWEKSRLSHQLTRMQQRGLVVREGCAEDSRGAVYRLTHAGRAAVDAALDSRAAAVRAYVLEVLTPAQLGALGEIADAIMAGLSADEPHPRAAAGS